MDEPAPSLVVVGASVGGVEALTALAAGLPEDLPAAVCIVLHVASGAEPGTTASRERAQSEHAAAVSSSSDRPDRVLPLAGLAPAIAWGAHAFPGRS